MKTKWIMFVVFSAIVLGGNVRAGVVAGIITSSGSNTSTVSGQLLSFSTTSLGGAKVAGFGLYSGIAVTGTGTVTFSNAGNTDVHVGNISFSSAILNGGNVFTSWSSGNGNLLASQTYRVDVAWTGSAPSELKRWATSYTVEPGVADYWWQPSISAFSGDAAAVQIYYDTTSVSEPGTLILTGSALAVGAIGAYIKRRRKSTSQADAAV